MAGLSEWIRQIILVLLLTGVVELALPRGSMRRYVQVVLGLFVLLAIIRPVLAWLGSEPANLVPAWQKALQEAAGPGGAGSPAGAGEVAPDLAAARERTRLLALDVHRQRLLAVVREEVRSAAGTEPVAIDLDLVSDPASPRWGAVTAITVHLPGRLPAESRPLPEGGIRPVEPVEIGPVAPGEDTATRPVPPALRAQLARQVREAVAARLDLNPAAVTVAWVETVEGR